jgi:hypothetical protein
MKSRISNGTLSTDESSPTQQAAPQLSSHPLASMAAEPKILELSNGTITARIASWGATITSLLVPDAHCQHRISVSGFVESTPR